MLLRDGDAAQLPSGAWLWPLCKLASAKSFVREATAMSLIPGPPKMLSYPGFPPSECKMLFGKCNNKPRTPAHLLGGFNWNHRTSDWWWGCCYKPLIEFAWCLPWKCFFPSSFLLKTMLWKKKKSIFLICKSLKLAIGAQPPPDKHDILQRHGLFTCETSTRCSFSLTCVSFNRRMIMMVGGGGGGGGGGGRGRERLDGWRGQRGWDLREGAVSGCSRLSGVDADNGLSRHARFDPFTAGGGRGES